MWKSAVFDLCMCNMRRHGGWLGLGYLPLLLCSNCCSDARGSLYAAFSNIQHSLSG